MGKRCEQLIWNSNEKMHATIFEKMYEMRVSLNVEGTSEPKTDQKRTLANPKIHEWWLHKNLFLPFIAVAAHREFQSEN